MICALFPFRFLEKNACKRWLGALQAGRIIEECLSSGQVREDRLQPILPLPGSPVSGEQVIIAVLNASALRHAHIMTLESARLSPHRITIHRRFIQNTRFTCVFIIRDRPTCRLRISTRHNFKSPTWRFDQLGNFLTRTSVRRFGEPFFCFEQITRSLLPIYGSLTGLPHPLQKAALSS